MSRETYSDDYDEQQAILWNANLTRSKRGRRGRAALLELRKALLALPHKRLIRNRLAANGDVCTVGALVLMRKAKELGSVDEAQAALEEIDAWCTCQHRKTDHDDRGVCLACMKSHARERLANEYSLWTWAFLPYARAPRPWSEAHVISGRALFASGCLGFTPWVLGEDDVDDDDDSSLTLSMAEDAGVPSILAWSLVAQNDDVAYGLGQLTPEERYTAVLRRIEGDLREMGAL